MSTPKQLEEKLDLAEDLEDITQNSLKLNKIPAEVRLKAVYLFLVLQSSLKVSKELKLQGYDIPASTIRYWKNNQEWWRKAYNKAKKEKNEELDGLMTASLHRSVDIIADRLNNDRDYGYTKDGVEIRKKVALRDAVGAMNLLHHNRSLVRGDPTSIQSKVTQESVVNDLKAQLASLAKAEQEKVVDGEFEVINPNKEISDEHNGEEEE